MTYTALPPRFRGAPWLRLGLLLVPLALLAACSGSEPATPVAAGPPPPIFEAGTPSASVPSNAVVPPVIATPDTPAVYIVKRGDTGLAIAARFQITLADLARANGQTEEELDFLAIGQELKIPR